MNDLDNMSLIWFFIFIGFRAQVRVKLMNGTIYAVPFEPSDTIEDIRAKIQEENQVSTNGLVFIIIPQLRKKLELASL